jgi:hypothetical protein
MTRKIYDAGRAEALIPLLRSITDEIQEREEAIDRGTARLQNGNSTLTAADRQALAAELSVHKRELRFALRELERLGCALDLDHPLRVLIPGSTTELGRRFEWRPEDTKIQAR